VRALYDELRADPRPGEVGFFRNDHAAHVRCHYPIPTWPQGLAEIEIQWALTWPMDLTQA